ncbi:sensor histidine kinase [Longimicrobium terrae]|uniref:histidine kinase n=1 Tax=Longimicrobium terrae TaxID=1639882 RepID=A0A841H2L5_9BACT|nr:ATP-binding protein [Longimicrobium terrae]MBB4637961.1 signal transduction histidine kinase [Longimicrobium terrae]MBB6072208.1 signal transduction histidine kinase [Longimicrobium terrae]NNC28366.1 response regulator [Longimicrobium terrae]
MNEPDLTACTLLLVDDEEANLDLLERILRRDGHHDLLRTADPVEAVELFDRHAPDLVLLDLHMPRRDGFAVLADLRARIAPDDFIPVLVLTADATFDARQRALGEGAQDFITKPFHNAEVQLRVRNLLRGRVLHRQQRRARRDAELLAEAGRILHASFDTATAAAQLARLVVPRLADRCVVDLLEDDRRMRVASARPGAEGVVLEMAPEDCRVPMEDGERVRRMGGADGWISNDDVRGLEAWFGADAPASALVVPLAVSGAPVGWLALGRGADGRAFDAEDEALAAELAHRAALAVENARLYHASRAALEGRDQVLAIVAHDLRGPLTAILFDAEMLRSDLPPGMGEYEARSLERVQQAAERMDGLIQDLLDVSRLSRSALALDRSPQDMGVLLAEAAGLLEPLAAGAGLTLYVDAGDAPVLVADPTRMLQVISNLVGNAVKFSPSAGVVTLAWGMEAGEFRVSVADQGAGIPAAQLQHIFGAFWQARHADRRGLGLGLAIAREIVEAHGGRIWVESEEDRGSVFHVALPLSETVSEADPIPLPLAVA